MKNAVFTKRFTELKLENNLSTTQISKKLDITQSSVHKFCTGENTPSFENFLKIANLFNVSLDWLVGRTENKEVNK
jgi:transcriptional regulator with XRE-family HTH domain